MSRQALSTTPRELTKGVVDVILVAQQHGEHMFGVTAHRQRRMPMNVRMRSR
jgi:hypothetical protein